MWHRCCYYHDDVTSSWQVEGRARSVVTADRPSLTSARGARGRLTLVEIQVCHGTAPELSVARDRFHAFSYGSASNGGAALRHFCHAIHLSPISSGLTETGHHDDVASLLLLPRRCHIVVAGQGQSAQRNLSFP